MVNVMSSSFRKHGACRQRFTGTTGGARGFTLIELLVVLAIIATLLTLAVPRYFSSVGRGKETVLRENLRSVRETIDKYYADTGRYPDSLQDLVSKHYLHALPVDPITGSTTSWIIVPPTDDMPGEVFTIRSGAQGVTVDGTKYSDL